MKNYYPPLIPNTRYHIFNRGNNRENVFLKHENYGYFLGKYAKYMSPVLDTYAYCLLPNHFHLAARVKTWEEIVVAAAESDLPGFKNLAGLGPSIDTNKYVAKMVSEQFRLCFMSYAKAINKQEDRVGSLFQKNFKRLIVDSQDYMNHLIQYIHANPQLHCIWDDYKEWPYSSFASLLSDGTTKLQRTEVLGWFGGKDGMMDAHTQYMDFRGIVHLIIED